MRILMTIHHHLDPNLGAPGATLTLGKVMESLGATVEYFGFEKAFDRPTDSHWPVGYSVKFPWKTAAYLARHAGSFDVLDATTGDACYWLLRRRPGSKDGGSLPALVTRAHGLEHVVDRQVREDVRAGRQKVSLKYPLYHGGYRLWEVAKSLRGADRVLLLNDIDRQYAHEQLHIPQEKIAVVPMGVADYFFPADGVLPPLPSAAADYLSGSDSPIRLAFLASWIPRKGSQVVVEGMRTLRANGVPFLLTLYGTGKPEEEVLADFDPEVRPSIRVVPRYQHTELPALLRGNDVLLFPSLAEGFSRALVEAMACGLAPVATPVGGAPAVLREWENGILIPTGDAAALAAAVTGLRRDPARLYAIRRQAQQDAAAYRWDHIARQTLSVYEAALREAHRRVHGAPPASPNAVVASAAVRTEQEIQK